MICTSALIYSQNIINDNNVNVRDYPSVLTGKVICKINKDTKVNIHCQTNIPDTINGKTNYWFQVETTDGKINGWVFGDFISLGKDNYIIKVVKENILRIKYANELLRTLYNGDGLTTYNIKLLQNYKLKDSKTTTFWQMKESGFTQLNTYETEFGELIAFVNTQKSIWRFNGLKIEKKNISDFFKINVNISYYESSVGKDFKTTKDKIEYDLSEYDDAFVYCATIKDDNVVSFELWKYFD
jgi:hypothetical protein